MAGGSALAADPPPASDDSKAAAGSKHPESMMVYGRRVPYHDPRFKSAPTVPPPDTPTAEMKASHDPVTGAQLGQFGDAYMNSSPLTTMNPANQGPDGDTIHDGGR